MMNLPDQNPPPALTVRPLEVKDYQAWLPLWDGNNQGERDEEATALTWKRINSAEADVHGLCAEKDGEMAGLLHYILHPTTGSIYPVCYMQDVYVAPAFRKQGIARALVVELAKIGQSEKWARMYWLAESSNKAAESLYKNFGVKLDFSFYVLPLRMT